MEFDRFSNVGLCLFQRDTGADAARKIRNVSRPVIRTPLINNGVFPHWGCLTLNTQLSTLNSNDVPSGCRNLLLGLDRADGGYVFGFVVQEFEPVFLGIALGKDLVFFV